jgi:hypothetical protein
MRGGARLDSGRCIMGGWSAVKALRKGGAEEIGDERVLGSGKFVEALLEGR